MTKTKLDPCPWCKGENIAHLTWSEYSRCRNCGLAGPSNDPTGAKWNALPRELPLLRAPTDEELAAIDARKLEIPREDLCSCGCHAPPKDSDTAIDMAVDKEPENV